MDFQSFKKSINNVEPEEDLHPLLKAMWYAANQQWDIAHSIAQDDPSNDGSWVHAYLHRLEGDHGNAAYWYSRSGYEQFNNSIVEEWDDISKSLLEKYD